MQQNGHARMEERKDRILRVLAHLGLEQAHFAASEPEDWIGLATNHAEVIASLALICPWDFQASQLAQLEDRLFVFSGDQPVDGERAIQVMQELPAARHVIVPGYTPLGWTDIIKDHTEQLGSALFDFWTSHSIGASHKLPALRPAEGEVAEVSYQIRGSGEPLVLLPLGLAPSGWEPLLAQLSEHFCTIVLGGAELGILPALEHRGRSAGYRRMIRNLFAEIELKPGERILEEVDADQMLAELIRVTKPGGRIGVIVRAMDIPFTLNVPVRKELKASFEFPAWDGEGEACVSASLYRRFRNAQLINPRLWPQLISFDNPGGVVERFMQGGLLTQLSAEELNEYQSALNQATAEGTFFITWPHHCAVGTKPLA